MKILNQLPCIVLLALSFSQILHAQFTVGDLVVVRVGKGDSTLNSASTAVFLDEYTSEGSFVRSLPLPVSTNGSDQPLTLGGSSTSEGGLTRSPDGKYITLAGYAVAPGTVSVSSSSSSAVNRVIARIDASDNINSTTRLSSFFNGSNIRSAVTYDGTGFWAAGNSSNSTGAGIVYISLGDIGGTKILDTPNNTRCAEIFNDQLYATSGTNGYAGIFRIGSGLPTTSGQTQMPSPGFDTLSASPYSFAIDTNATICFVADSRSIANGGGVQKWIFKDTAWILSDTFTNGISTGVYGLAVDWTAPCPKIYATTAGRIVKFTDSTSVHPTAIIIAAASSNTAFRGISFAPVLSQSNVYEVRKQSNSNLLANYPNPFNPETIIKYTILRSGHVRLAVYNVLGCKMADLVNEHKYKGEYRTTFSGSGLPGGIYFIRLQTGMDSYTRKILLIK